MRRLFFLSVIVFFLGGCQFFEFVRSGESRLESLEREHRVLQAQLEKEKKDHYQLRIDYAEINAGLNNLRDEVQVLRGELEEAAYFLDRHIQEYKAWKQAQENALSVKQVPEKASPEPVPPVSVPPVAVEVSGPAVPAADKAEIAGQSRDASRDASMSESDLYAAGRQLFDAADYAGARGAFEEFLKRYPESKECDNAHFWIGETYYREERYEKAILEYQNVIDKYPGTNKMPAALLKQGMAFNKIKDDINARLVLKRLVRDFPASPEAKEAGKLLKVL